MSEWASQLERFVTKGQKKSVSESGNKNIDKEADICFLKLLEEEQQAELKQNSTYSKIPRFYFKKPETKNQIYMGIRQEARTRFLHNKSAEILDKEDLEKLWYLLKLVSILSFYFIMNKPSNYL